MDPSARSPFESVVCGYRRAGTGGVTAAETGQLPERQGEGSPNMDQIRAGCRVYLSHAPRSLGVCLIKKVVSGAVITKTAKRKVKLRREARTLKAKALCSLRRAVTAFNACDDDGRTTCVLLHMQHAAKGHPGRQTAGRRLSPAYQSRYPDFRRGCSRERALHKKGR